MKKKTKQEKVRKKERKKIKKKTKQEKERKK